MRTCTGMIPTKVHLVRSVESTLEGVQCALRRGWLQWWKKGARGLVRIVWAPEVIQLLGAMRGAWDARDVLRLGCNRRTIYTVFCTHDWEKKIPCSVAITCMTVVNQQFRSRITGTQERKRKLNF